MLASSPRTAVTAPVRLIDSLRNLGTQPPAGTDTAASVTFRYSLLLAECQLLSSGFEDLDAHVARYVRDVPLDTADSSTFDAERFLDWLDAQLPISAEQHDFLTCQRSQFAVEFVAVKQRLEHARFQSQRAEQSTPTAVEIQRRSAATITINPTHFWTQLETRALLDDETDIPATVLFFADGPEVHAAVVEGIAEQVLRTITRRSRLTIGHLLRKHDASQQEEIISAITTCIDLGIVVID